MNTEIVYSQTEADKASELGATGFLACYASKGGPSNEVSIASVDNVSHTSYSEALSASIKYCEASGSKIEPKIQAYFPNQTTRTAYFEWYDENCLTLDEVK